MKSEQLNGILADMDRWTKNARGAFLNLPVEEMNKPAENFIEMMKWIHMKKEE